jgi:Na+-driven multidrug efflux pump
MAPTVITTIGVAHAANASASLIVWPVLIQFAALFTSPMTDWESVSATALRDDRRNRAPRRLTVSLAAAVTALFVAAYLGGITELFVRGLLAVPPEAAGLGLRWMWLLLPLPALWVARAYLRGILMAADDTRWLSYAGLGHVVVLVGTLTVLAGTGLPGVACAGIAITAGVAVETLVTAYGGRSPRRVSPYRRG